MKPDQMLQLLPDVVRRTWYPGSVLDDLLGVMSLMHGPVEEVLTDFGAYVDPTRCPDPFVAMLAHWVGFGWLSADGDPTAVTVPVDAMRTLVVSAGDLAKLRGTRVGLERILTMATTRDGFAVLDDPVRPFGIVVRCPDTARPVADLITRIVRHEKPAFCTASIAFGDQAASALSAADAEGTQEPPVEVF